MLRFEPCKQPREQLQQCREQPSEQAVLMAQAAVRRWLARRERERMSASKMNSAREV